MSEGGTKPGGLAVFGYGSLVSPQSASLSLARPVEVIPATLAGWRRGWTIERNNHAHEKSFERVDGTDPIDWCLGLNIGRDPAAMPQEWPNGALIALEEGELSSLERRELRYDPHDATAAVRIGGEAALPPGIERVVVFSAKAEHRAPDPHEGAVILSAYLETVEAAFDELGPGELEAFRRTTGEPPAEVVKARLARDEIPAGNPRDW